MSRSASADDTLRTEIEGIARICLDPGFESLRTELQALYTGLGVTDPSLDAFVDAYYAFVQEGHRQPDRTISPDTVKTPDPNLSV